MTEKELYFLPHPRPTTRRPMSAPERAAQFAPFAARSGFGGEISEAGRRTERRTEPDEATAAQINERLGLLAAYLARCKNGDDLPEVVVTYFRPDPRKEGGEYRTASGAVKTVDEYARVLVLTDGTRIPFADIFALGGG